MSYRVPGTRAAVGAAVLEAAKTTAGLTVTLSLCALGAATGMFVMVVTHPEVLAGQFVWGGHG